MRQGLNKLTAILLVALMLLAVLPVSALGTEQYSDPVMPGISLTSILPGETNVVTYVFYNGENVADTQRVKDGETLVEPEAPDAGEGKAFSGWYTEGGEKFTAFGAQTVTATATVNLYARFVDAYYIYFHTPDGSTVKHTEVVMDHASHDFSGISYEIADVTKGVIGWASMPNGMEDVSKNISVPEGQTSVSLYAIIGEGYYVTFETGAGTVIAPRFVKNGETLSLSTVANPTLFGYEFGGWYMNEACTTPAGTTISSETTLFAKWNPMDANLTVVFWYENADDEGYSFAGSASVNAKTGAEVSSADYQNHNFTGRDATHFTYNTAKVETVTVKGDGSSVLNVYYTRNEYTLTFKNGQQTLTCTKTEHEHSDACCKYGGTSGSHWYHRDSCCKLGLSEHTHNKRCYQSSDLIIKAKYQADIHSNFPIKSGEKTIWWNVPNGCKSFEPGTQLGSIDIMPGENITFTMNDAESGADLYYYIETLAGETGTYTHDGKNFKLYKTINLSRGDGKNLTYTEEFHNITGFTQWWSDPAFDKMAQGGRTSGIKSKNYLCYTRNSYDLKFYNYNGYITEKQKSVQYETPLKDYNFEPSRPSGLDEDVQYTFGGWYTTSECYVGSEFEWEKATMPASDVILYAKWIPQKYTVSFGLGYETSEAAPETQTVDAKTMAEKPADPVRDGYTFIGWYDTDENGKQLSETPFNFDTRITKNTHLVAHWTTDRTFQLRYDANEAKGGVGKVPEDNNRYADGSKASVLDKGNLSNKDETKVFLGWSTNKDATTADYQPGEAKEIKADEAVDGFITLYAVWGPKPGTTTLTYNANYEGADPMTAEHLENGSAILPNNATVQLYGEKTFTRPGYKLIGWAKEANASKPDYSFDQSVIVDTVGENVLYAVWEKSTVKLTITKQVTGIENDTTAFTFNVSYQAGADTVAIPAFTLTSGRTSEEFELPIGAVLTIVEGNAARYTTTAQYGSTTATVAEDTDKRTITGITVNETDTSIVVTNAIKTGKLTIVKEVTGSLGDKLKKFDFTCRSGGVLESASLANGESKEMVEIPYGTEVTITEKEYTGYETSYKVGTAETATSGLVATVTIDKDKETVTFINHKDAHPDTGVLLDSLPYILIIACVAAIGAFIVILRRKNRED